MRVLGLKLEEIFEDSFSYVKNFLKNLGRYLILAVLSIIPILNFIVYGYGWKIIEETPQTNNPPQLEGFFDLWIKGLKIVVVTIIYMIIPIILFSFAAYLWRSPFMGFPHLVFANITFLGLGIILTFLFSIILAIATAHMVKTDRFSGAFSVGEILKIIGKIGWGKYLAWLIVIFILEIIVGSLGAIPHVGWIILLLVSPLVLVFVSRSLAQLCSEAEKV